MLRNKIIISITALLLCINGYSAGKIQSTKVAGVTYVNMKDVASYYKFKLEKSSGGFTLKGANWGGVFKFNDRKSTINKTNVYLADTPKLIKSIPYLSKTDFLKTIDPLIRNKALPLQRVKRICIDPGHGGRDQGATSLDKKYTEKALNLELAKRVKKELEKSGFEVSMTRTGDSKLSLASRCEIAKKKKAQLFVSIHANSLATKGHPENKKVVGIETFVIPSVGTNSTAGKKMNVKTVGHKYESCNNRLAYELQRGLIQKTKAKDRGLKRKNLSVLRNSSIPAALVEVGFLSSTKESKLLYTKAYQDKVVAGICQGIRQYAAAMLKKQ